MTEALNLVAGELVQIYAKNDAIKFDTTQKIAISRSVASPEITL